MKKTNPLIPLQLDPSQSGHQAGMTLIEVMIAVAISSIVVMASLSIGNMTANIQSQNNFSFQADMIRRSITTLILSNQSWANTQTANGITCIGTVTGCGSTVRTLNQIYNATNAQVYDVSAGHGFNMDGTACTSTTPPCVLTFTVTMTPICTINTCSPTQVKVDVTAHYNAPTGGVTFGQHNMVFNEINYSATLYR
jgi:prepilin-type N-terminal cleavage/methylation domain-containing protein